MEAAWWWLPLLARCSSTAPPQIGVAVLDSMVRHNAYLPLPPPRAGKLEATIAAAGREHESVQVLLRSSGIDVITPSC